MTENHEYQRQDLRILYLATILLVCIISVVLYFDRGLNYFGSGELLCLSLMVFIVTISPVLWQGSHDILEPIHLVAGSVLIGFVLRSMYIVFGNKIFAEQEYLIDGSINFLIKGAAISMAGMLFFAAGYLAKIPPIDLSRLPGIGRTEWNRRRVFIIALISFSIAVVSLILFCTHMKIDFSDISHLSQKRFLPIESATDYQYSALGYLRLGINFSMFAFLLLIFYAMGQGGKKDTVTYLAAFIVVIPFVLYAFLSSSRTELLKVFIIPLIAVHYLKRRLNIKKVLVTCLLFAGIVTIMGIMREQRHIRHNTNAVNRINVVDAAIDKMIVNKNFFCIGKTSMIIKKVPKNFKYLHGSSLVSVIFAPIPHTLWPQKPENLSLMVGKDMYGLPENARVGVPPGLTGELYFNFGIFAVLIGLFLFGVFLKAIYKGLSSQKPITKNYILIYSALLFYSAYGLIGGDMTSTLVKLLTSIIPLLFLLFFIAEKKAPE